ncbi:MAG TPA: LysR family transcriptional regulator, partial [Phycisphaerales bacterium]|nr:LysR family transcriptional regulator [Phycisphaerales bacterium]
MELTPLRYFRAIVAAGHMTRAARTLGITQPALSAVVKKLEAEVGARLLNRTGLGVEPTEAGRILLRHAEEAIRSADTAVKAVRELLGLEHGSIRIGGGATATTSILPQAVSATRARHPGLRFFVREAGSAQVAFAVATGELDLGIVTLPVPRPMADDLVILPLVRDELRLITPASHPLRVAEPPARNPPDSSARPRPRGSPRAASTTPGGSARSFRWSQLSGEAFVAFEAGSAVRSIIDEAARTAGVTLNVVMELRSIESIKRMVAAGIGVGLVSRFALSPDEGLTASDGTLIRQLGVVRHKDR